MALSIAYVSLALYEDFSISDLPHSASQIGRYLSVWSAFFAYIP